MTGFNDEIGGFSSGNGALIIRDDRPGDRAALTRLAQRDTSRVPAGRLVVAEQDGELRVAVPIQGGRAIADPFRPTAAIVSMLEIRAGLLRVGL